MAINLGARPSDSPLPSGQLSRVWGQDTSQEQALPAGGNYLWANAPTYTIPMRTGPFQNPYRYWLCAGAFYIHRVAGAWEAHVGYLRLVNLSGTPINDLNGIGGFEQYSTVENHGGLWHNASIEGKFYCEANQGYYVQLLSMGGGGWYWTGYRQHLQMFSYTVGDGVY
jgi:hypothetical protein